MMTSNELLAFIPPEVANDIIEHAYAADKPVYRATMAAVAEARRVRPVFLERQPRVQRHKLMLEMLTKPHMEPAASNLIRTWLLKKQTAMLADFLDHLGIPHKEGVVDDLPEKVEDEKLKAAVDFLLEKHPREAVIVYLHAFNTMNETSWTNLSEMLDKDPRLQL
ncbi:hypothetical protein NXS98_06990 [Fontisphaera persica]|jgi:hypothetical protein|uniref:hypothetical protein n=1 Tax=Fontisphaera persica TaxID=2974023 RepID=UPI0024C0C8ED|nr:hypothetical protein [Fontisphaera persica]WCJ60867.1 hypothetical protein NXS98_06990 [Fontisphaera persica]